MTYQTLDAINTTKGMHMIFLYANDVTGGLLARMMLFGFFAIIMFASYLTQQRMNGKDDFAASFAIAGFVTVGLAIIMSLLPGMINAVDILVIISVNILGAYWFITSRTSD